MKSNILNTILMQSIKKSPVSKGVPYALLSTFFLFTALAFPGPTDTVPKEYKQTAVNVYKDGGILKKWIIIGPFYRTGVKDTVPWFERDHLVQIGSEATTLIQHTSFVYLTDKKGNREAVRPQSFETDSTGMVCLNRLFTGDSEAVVYAFCLIEAFIEEKIRCFWGVDGMAKVWINGKEKENIWDGSDLSLPSSKYFDADIKQGMNSVLLKLTNSEKNCCYSFETIAIVDSLKPFRDKIGSLSIELSRQEINRAQDSIQAKLKFNIPVPAGVFDGIAHILYRGCDTLQYIPITVEEPFTVTLPDSVRGIVQIIADVKVAGNMTLSSERYVWKGDFNKSLRDQMKRFERIRKGSGLNKSNNKFIATFIHGIQGWAEEWFLSSDSLGTDEKIKQFGYIQSNGDAIEWLLSGKKIEGNRMYPVLFHIDSKKEQKRSSEYDPSRWLNYKYPDQYALPETQKESTNYPAWLFLPAAVVKNKRTMPLILSLHGAEHRSYNISSVRKYGLLKYAESVPDFPAAIVAPQCRQKTLWDSARLKGLLDFLLNTGRFDEKRIYITGFGMGGFTSWHLACSYPKYFAAIIPINASGNKDKACSVKNVPVWAFHGVGNKLIPLEESQKMITALKECNAPQVELSIYTEYGQDISTSVYSNPKLYTWLLKQKR